MNNETGEYKRGMKHGYDAGLQDGYERGYWDGFHAGEYEAERRILGDDDE